MEIDRKKPGRWYEGFFFGLAQDFWKAVVPEAVTRAEVQLVEETLRPPRGGTLLDVPCGFGRHALPLARKGYAVTGVDISQDTVNELRRTAAAERLPMRLLTGNILTLRLPRNFDGALCLGNSFGYFGGPDDARFIRRVASALKPAGRFLLNTATVAESLLPNYPEDETLTVDGISLRLRDRYDARESVLVTEYAFQRSGRQERRTSRHSVYTVAEVIRFCEAAGLRVLDLFGSTERDPYRLGAPQLYLLAEKDPTRRRPARPGSRSSGSRGG